MDVVAVFAIVATIIGIGFLSEIIFRRTHIPDVIFLIAVGILLGSVLQWITPSAIPYVDLFTTFTLVFLLFQGALNINVHELRSSFKHSVQLTFWGFVLSAVIVTAIAVFAGFPVMTAVLLGVMLAGTSSAVVVPLVAQLRMHAQTRIVAILESAITDVLCIVGALMVLGFIDTGVLDPYIVLNSFFRSFGIAIIIGTIIGLLWVGLLHRYEDLMHAYMVTIAAVIGTYAVTESVQASGAIAALSFGLVLGNSKNILHKLFHGQRPQKDRYLYSSDIGVVRDVLSSNARRFYSEISFFVKVFFFVYIGVLIDFTNITLLGYSILITLGIFVLRPLAVRLTYGKRIPHTERTYLEILTPKGLAPVVLAQLAVQAGVPMAQQLADLVVFVVFTSILFASLLVFLAGRGQFRGFWHRSKPQR